MSDQLRKFQNAAGQSLIFQHFVIDLTALHHLALSLRRRGSTDKATQALIQALSELGSLPQSGFDSRESNFHSDSTIVMLARNHLAELTPPQSYDKLPEAAQHKAQSLFGRSFWGDEYRAVSAVHSIPALDAERLEVCKTAASIVVWAPRGVTEDIQRSPLHNEEAVTLIANIGAGLERASALYDAAMAEWAHAKLARPRSNPFAKPLALYQTAQWEEHEEESSLRSGSFWMPAAETPSGLMFLSPNGYKMRDVSRGKPFDSSEAALEWGRRYGATAAVELNWSLASFVPCGNASNPSLDKIFAVKESRELGALISPATQNPSASDASAQASPKPASRRAKGSL